MAPRDGSVETSVEEQADEGGDGCRPGGTGVTGRQLAGALAGAEAPLRIDGDLRQRLGERRRVVDGDAVAVDAVLDQAVAAARRLARHQRETGRGRLVQHHAPRLRPRWENEAVRTRIELRQLLARELAEQLHAAVRLAPQLCLLRPAPGD